MSAPILDCERARSLRLERGLSQREVARRLRVSSTVIRYLEEGRNHPELSLRFLDELADALAVDPAALLRHRQAASGSADSDKLDADLRKLGAVIASERVGLSSKALALATGWNLDRLANAREALNKQLQTVGMTLSMGASGWKLQPDMTTLSWEDELRLSQARHSERGLLLREAELLRAAIDGTLTPQWEQNIGNADRVALGGLLKSGLAIRSEEGVVPSATVVRSLEPIPSTKQSVARIARGSRRG